MIGVLGRPQWGWKLAVGGVVAGVLLTSILLIWGWRASYFAAFPFALVIGFLTLVLDQIDYVQEEDEELKTYPGQLTHVWTYLYFWPVIGKGLGILLQDSQPDLAMWLYNHSWYSTALVPAAVCGIIVSYVRRDKEGDLSTTSLDPPMGRE
jgi:MFS family permease